MDLIKKFGPWALAGVLVISAIAFYFLSARGLREKEDAKLREIAARLDELKGLANKQAKGPQWVQYAREQTKIWQGELDEARKYLGEQPRQCQTRIFYTQELADVAQFHTVVSNPAPWLQRYLEEQKDLQAVVQRQPWLSGMSPKFATWGTRLPSTWEIQAAQSGFWFQKDMIDLLGYNERHIINEMLKRANFEHLHTLYDLVRNPHLSEPSGALFSVDRAVLEKVLVEILSSPAGCDLRLILGRYPQGGEYRTLWDLVYDKTTEPEQRIFIGRLHEDWANLVTFIMDVRAVRYRSDLLWMLRKQAVEEPKIEPIIHYLEKPTPAGKDALADEIRTWNNELIAQVIGYVVSIDTRRDFETVRRNHEPTVLAVSWTTSRDPSMIDLSANIVNDQYIAIPFKLNVTMEFQLLPVFMRRLLLSTWRIAIYDIDVQKGTAPGRAEGGMMPTEGAMPDPRGMGGEPPAPGIGPAAPAKPETGGEGEVVVMAAQPQRVVNVAIRCEARLFFPLWKALHAKEAEKIAMPPAGGIGGGRPGEIGRP